MIDQKRMANWGRWLRRGYHPAQAFSVEGNYRIPRDPYEVLPPRPANPDEADAWDIEVACRLLPMERHVLLKLLHVYRLPGPQIQRAMRREFGSRMTASDMDAAEAMSLVMLEDLLGVPAVVRKHRAQMRVRRILQLYVEQPLMATG